MESRKSIGKVLDFKEASFGVLGYFPVLLEDLLLPMQFEEFKSALQRMSGCLSNPSPIDDGSEEQCEVFFFSNECYHSVLDSSLTKDTTIRIGDSVLQIAN